MKFIKALAYVLIFSFCLISCSSSPVSQDGGSFKKPLPETTAAPETCVPVLTVPPAYPRNALAGNVEGWAQIGFNLDGSGKAANVKVLDESFRGFGSEGVRAVHQFGFDPSVIEDNCSYIFTFRLAD